VPNRIILGSESIKANLTDIIYNEKYALENIINPCTKCDNMRINPKQLEKMARKMGMQTEQIDAEEVIIKTPENEIVISNPQVARVNMMGQDTFQISGDVSERSREKFSEEDIKMIMEQAGVSEAEARAALEETNDMAEAILRLKSKK